MDFIYGIFGVPLGYVMWAIYSVVPIYALALFLFTLASKIILFPFSIKTHKASATQLYWRPRMDAIKKKYGKDKERQNKEIQKLYTEEGMKMNLGCGVQLIQFPIFFGLIDVVYRPLTHILRLSSDKIAAAVKLGSITTTGLQKEIAIINAIKDNPGEFGALGTPTLNSITNLDLSFFGLDLIATPTVALNILLIIPLLSFVTSLLQTYVSTKINPAMKAQTTGKGMLYGMALIFVVFTFMVPAGVGIYWSFSNILIIVQMFILSKLYPADIMLAKIKEQHIEKKKGMKTATVKVETKEGVIVEKNISKKELDKLRLAKARELEEALYNETLED